MSEELKKLVEDLGKSFYAFKTENDTRLKEIENKKHTDPLLTEKVEKIAKEIVDFESMRQQFVAIEKAVANIEARGIGEKGKEKKTVYNHLGEQLLDVMAVANPNKGTSQWANAMERLTKVQAAASGANETIPSEGGFLVEKDSATILSDNSIATGLLSRRCFHVPLSENSNGLKLKLMKETSRANGSRYGGIQAYWAAEADTVTATKPTFREATWELKKLFGLFYATEEILKDASAMAAVVNRWFPMEFGFKIDDAIFRGTGGGIPSGILNAGCTVSQAIETGQVRATDPILYKNCANMYARLLNSSDDNAVWLINRAMMPSLMMMTMPVGTGGSAVFLPSGGASVSPYMTLFNKSIIPIEQCEAPATVGDIVLADLKEYLIIDKGGIQNSVSIHVRFIYDEQTFKWTYRIDGAPIRNAVLTPYKGDASWTQGPFVTLAAS